ncbi:MAG: type 4a pilus biogenesis protein PilO [Burkholderiales bacterium]|jgi:type IV pilus assembly protein PilO|nr:type 4a pilus biogenesis protein PilO [Burkholderiales bacterium]
MTLDELRRLDPKSIGSWPIPVKFATLIILLALVIFLGYWFDWRNQLAEINTLRERESTLRTTFIDKKRQAINLPAYQKQLEDIEQAFGALLRQLPNRSEMDALLTDINQAGLGRGLQFELFKPATQETTSEFYAELPINIRVTGSYHELGSFASDIAQLPRIVTLNDVAVAVGRDGMLTMDAVAKTFRYLDEEELAKQRKAAQAAPKKK